MGLLYGWACFWYRQTVNRPASTRWAQIASQECHQASSMIELSARRASAMPGKRRSKVRANILDATAPLMLCSNVPDWPAKCAVSGFVFWAIFWAAFFMPAAARAQNLPPAPWAQFRNRRIFVFGVVLLAPSCWFICRAALASHPGDQFSSHFGGRVSGPLGGPKKLTQAHSGPITLKLTLRPESGLQTWPRKSCF